MLMLASAFLLHAKDMYHADSFVGRHVYCKNPFVVCEGEDSQAWAAFMGFAKLR